MILKIRVIMHYQYTKPNFKENVQGYASYLALSNLFGSQILDPSRRLLC